MEIFYYKDIQLSGELTNHGISEATEIKLNEATFKVMWPKVAELPDEIGHPFDHMNNPATNPLSSPEGQEILKEIDVWHTSMSVGDCYRATDGKLLMLMGVGVAEVTLV